MAAVELAYNIVDALRRHAPQHSDCRAFQEMLAGNMLLAVWMDRCAVVEKLRVGLLLAVSLGFEQYAYISIGCLALYCSRLR